MQISDQARKQFGLSLPQSHEVLAVLENWTSRAKAASAGLDPDENSSRLSRLIFEVLKIEREVDDEALRFVLLPQVLTDRRGSCVGLVSLYLVLAQRLQLQACAVLAPGHLFVRSGPPDDRRNIELLRRGESMADGWYRKTYRVPAGVSAYMRCLSSREFLAVVRYNLANEYRARGLEEKAISSWTKVTVDFPDFPEAHANLGLAHHLAGDLEAAKAAYLKALRLHPKLPGLLHNLSLVTLQASYFNRILGSIDPATARPKAEQPE